jgi:hypothetical protein
MRVRARRARAGGQRRRGGEGQESCVLRAQTHHDTQELNASMITPPAQPRWTKVDGRPSTPAPTIAVSEWYAASFLQWAGSRAGG